MPTTELLYYDDLDPDGQAKLERLVVSSNFIEINPDSATYQNHTNGVLNNLPQALVNAIEQTESEKVTSHYNPTHGTASDLMESLVDKVFGNGVIQTGVASQTGEFLESVVTARPDQGSNFVAHSQGALLMNAGLNTLDKSDFDGVKIPESDKPTFFINEAPVQADTMENSVDRLEFKFSGSSANQDDPVAEFLGRNSGDYIPDQNIGSADPIPVSESLVSGVGNLPKAFCDKYSEYDNNGNQTNKLSPLMWEPACRRITVGANPAILRLQAGSYRRAVRIGQADTTI